MPSDNLLCMLMSLLDILDGDGRIYLDSHDSRDSQPDVLPPVSSNVAKGDPPEI